MVISDLIREAELIISRVRRKIIGAEGGSGQSRAIIEIAGRVVRPGVTDCHRLRHLVRPDLDRCGANDLCFGGEKLVVARGDGELEDAAL